MKPRVYIAGPMTGLPDSNYPAFNAAARAWRDRGWEVENPAEAFGGQQNLPYKDYVKHDLKVLKTCHAIALLPGWDGPDARGSVWEHEVAKLLGLRVLDASGTIPKAQWWHSALAKNLATTSEFWRMVEQEEAPPVETILQEAQNLVHGPRQAAYGHPIDDYTRTGRIWGAILGIPDIDPRLCAVMMGGVKMSREVNKHKRDNLVDLAGYAECANMIAERQGLG